jgi:hypothetical protein
MSVHVPQMDWYQAIHGPYERSPDAPPGKGDDDNHRVVDKLTSKVSDKFIHQAATGNLDDPFDAINAQQAVQSRAPLVAILSIYA